MKHIPTSLRSADSSLPGGQPHGDTVLVSSSQAGGLREVTIGRAPNNTITLDEPLVSRHRARLQPLADRAGFQIIDLGSLNGIQLNGRRVGTGAVFSPGDQLHVGRTGLKIVDNEIVAEAEQCAALIANELTVTLKGGKELLKNVGLDGALAAISVISLILAAVKLHRQPSTT